MAITFDKSLNVIEVTATTVTIQELINAIRDWEDSAEGITVKSVANAFGKQGLTETTAVGITLELINNWRIQFGAQSEWTTCYIEGGNLVATNDYGNDPIKPSPFVNTIIAQSISASLIAGSGSVWSESEKNALISTMNTIEQVNVGRWLIENNQLIMYGADNETEVARYNLYDREGEPAMDDVFERVRV